MQTEQKTRILITNDDGVNSENLHALARALAPLGEVFVCAPESEQSGVGQGFTVRNPIEVKKWLNSFKIPFDNSYEVFTLKGTPADCSKFAISNPLIPPFDVCFSGINKGENSGVSSLYSGTVAGAREGALWGIPGIALSLSLGGESLLDNAIQFAKRIISEKLFLKISKHTFWNVNFPISSDGNFKGYKVSKMCLGMFTDYYTKVFENDLNDINGIWQLDGEKFWDNQPMDSDDYLLNQGYATITPHRIDQTDLESFNEIKKMIN